VVGLPVATAPPQNDQNASIPECGRGTLSRPFLRGKVLGGEQLLACNFRAKVPMPAAVLRDLQQN
jgi:hypothetical protein